MATKTKTVYVCSNCGADSPKWFGRCTNCGEWNTCVEEKVAAKSSKPLSDGGLKKKAEPVKITEIKSEEETRIPLPSGELNRVLGGGLVPGSIILVGGEPGIGKSTLVLQNVLRIRSRRVLYVSGEESVQQLKMRADRIGGYGEGCECYIVCETSLEQIYVHPDKEVELIPRVGNHRILLGTFDHFEEKLANLRLFYEQAIPKMGWEKYSIINLKYRNQIVCTKR